MAGLNLVAPVELRAAAGEGKRPTVRITAYTGDPMRVGGFYSPVIVDLTGLELPSQVPLLADHIARLEGVLGAGTPSIQSGRLMIDGHLASGPAADRVTALARDGVALQASVGVDPGPRQRIDPGGKVTVNGRTIEAGPEGLTVIQSGRLREVSILPLGADPGTSVSIAARNPMPETTPPIGDPVQAERERVAAILEACDGDSDTARTAIEAGWSPEHARELAELRGSRATKINPIPFCRPSPIRADSRGTLVGLAMLMASHGPEAVAKHLPDGERLAATLSRPRGWPELAAAALSAEGLPIPHDRTDLIRAAFSTTSLPNALGNAVAKLALDPFLETAANWRAIVRRASASDFKEGRAIRLSIASGLQKLGPGGEIKHGDLGEDAYTFKVDTYARMLTVTRQDIINDDLSLFDDLPLILGAEGARAVADLVFEQLSGASTFFSVGKGNLVTEPLDVAGLSAAVEKLRVQTDRDGRVIGYRPSTLVVPAALEGIARSVLNSVTLQRDQSVDGQATANPVASLNLSLVVEPRLDAASQTHWFLFADPRSSAIIAAFLNGRESPTVEPVDAGPSMLGSGFRAYLDFGVSLAESKAVVKSAATTKVRAAE